ncbi:hypothetical protein F0L68_05065 [Solihabitans fulvus]|uniref:Uncharacterized protein n=1 Tax=Solihabitans fulvus TaxID=1892852 RepID=A0A5B2XQR6_9PSEU|nr:hypothetical protein [Solihabitans fulvus]KAA2265221.1 hypothetical protein F0L68_05065 [Solihabitans fulvus]
MSTTAQLLADQRANTAAVQGGGWRSDELTGSDGGLPTLGQTSSPLSGLADAGFGSLMGMVSFLEEPLKVLSGNPSSISSSSQGLHGAGTQVSSLADSYRQSTSAQTSSWSGAAGSDYRNAGSQHADGIQAIGEALTSIATAVAGAGEVVGQAVQIVTELITQAVGEIVPIMTQAVAAAPATFGQSIAVAIPQCVEIAVRYGQQIGQKLAALVSTGQNLMKLVTAGVQTAKAVGDAISKISKSASQGGSGGGTGSGAGGIGTSSPYDLNQGSLGNDLSTSPSLSGLSSGDSALSTSAAGLTGAGQASGIAPDHAGGTSGHAVLAPGARSGAGQTEYLAPGAGRLANRLGGAQAGGMVGGGPMAGGAPGGQSKQRQRPGYLSQQDIFDDGAEDGDQEGGDVEVVSPAVLGEVPEKQDSKD